MKKDTRLQRLIVSRKNCQVKKLPITKTGQRMDEAFTIRKVEPDKFPEIEGIFEA
ncbi:MAG: hypothetical protein HKO80_01755 [Flavobacteriaceae bacterium]|nr:hypothetical protein [Flavobacteriaceae bacterium]